MQFQTNAAFGAIFTIIMIFFVLIITIVQIVAFCKIFSKAGYSWALGLLMLVPIANIVMFFFGFCRLADSKGVAFM